MDRMTAAEVACTRHLLGLTADQMGAALGVNPRTVRSWEAGRDKPSDTASAAVRNLRAEHDQEVERLAASDAVIYLPDGPRPAGWYKALGARVLDREPDAMIEWLRE